MRLEQLEYLIAAAETGSLCAAARRLKVTQPAVSTGIRALEKEVGISLVKRGNSGVQLTPLGLMVCSHARKILELAGGILDLGTTADAGGSLVVCAQPLLSFYLTSIIVLPFRKLFPEIEVSVRNVPSANIIDELRNGHSSIALTLVGLGLKIRDLADSLGYKLEILFTDERKMFLGANHSLAQKATLCREDLKQLKIAYYSDPKDFVSSRYAPYFGGEYRLANRNDILDLVMRNEAVFIQAGTLFSQDFRVRAGLITGRSIPVPEVDHKAPVTGIRLPSLSPAESLFWDYLKENFTLSNIITTQENSKI